MNTPEIRWLTLVYSHHRRYSHLRAIAGNFYIAGTGNEGQGFNERKREKMEKKERIPSHYIFLEGY